MSASVSLGEVVIYVDFMGRERAAIVTGRAGAVVALTVFEPDGGPWNTWAPHDPSGGKNTWHPRL